MKSAYWLVFSVLFFLCSAVAFSNTQVIERFVANSSGEEVEIEWKTFSENGVARFEVQRQVGNDFKTINTQNANGKATTYKFTDSDKFNKNLTNDEQKNEQYQSSSSRTYRIKIVYNNSDVTYSNQVTVNISISNIKRTLGMLKEMFK